MKRMAWVAWGAMAWVSSGCGFDAQVASSTDAQAGINGAPAAALCAQWGVPHLQFAELPAGRAAVAQVRLSNCGTAPLTLEALSAAAPFGIQSPVSEDLPLQVASGASRQVRVVFAPSADGAQSGTLAAVVTGLADAVELPLLGLALPAGGVDEPQPVDCTDERVVEAPVYITRDVDPEAGTLVEVPQEPGVCFVVLGPVVVIASDFANLDVLRGVKEIYGDLFIGHPWGGNPVLENVDGLANLTTVRGDLTIMGNAALSSLAGLRSLVQVDGSLAVTKNGVLTSLHGLEALAHLGNGATTGSVLINENPLLAEVDGLSGLNQGLSSLSLYSNPSLRSISGLGGVGAITGTLAVAGQPLLTSLDGLQGVTSANLLVVGANNALTSLSGLDGVSQAGQVSIYYNNTLASLDGLGALQTAGTAILISNNPALVSLAGASSLRSADHVNIEANVSLTSLGLSGLTQVDQSIYVKRNTRLPTSLAYALVAQAGHPYYEIEDNRP